MAQIELTQRSAICFRKWRGTVPRAGRPQGEADLIARMLTRSEVAFA